MKYALVIYPKPASHEALTDEGCAPVNAQYFALREDPRCLGGAHLQPRETATTVRLGGAVEVRPLVEVPVETAH